MLRRFWVIYEKAEGNFSAYAPDLPGCIACGDTLEETEHLMKEAIQIYIEALKEEGLPIPEPMTTARSITIAA